MANLLINNYRPLLNGSAGLSLVPAPPVPRWWRRTLSDEASPGMLRAEEIRAGYGAGDIITVYRSRSRPGPSRPLSARTDRASPR
jgi:hypothetical protein